MFKFVLDLGTIINIVMALFYLIIVIVFMFCKIGSFGLKRNICMKSEEIWHKVHVAASFSTMPFVILSILLVFIENMWTKLFLAIILIIMVIVVWNIAANVVTKKDVEEIRKKEADELLKQIKKESGWR